MRVDFGTPARGRVCKPEKVSAITEKTLVTFKRADGRSYMCDCQIVRLVSWLAGMLRRKSFGS